MTLSNTANKTGSNQPARTIPGMVLITAVIAGSFATIFISLAQREGVPSLVIVAGRLVLASLLLTPFVLSRYLDELAHLNRSDIFWALLSGAFMALHFSLLAFALENTSALIVQVIVNTSPIWVALLEVTFLKAHLNRFIWIGLMIVSVGGTTVALTSGGSGALGDPLLGGALSLAGAMAGSVYMVIGRKIRAKITVTPYIWMVFGCAAMVSIMLVIITSTPVTGYPINGYIWIVLITLIPQLIGHGGFNFVLRYFSATLVTISVQVSPVIVGILGFFLLAQVPGPGDLIGSLIIIAGVLVAILGRSWMPSLAKRKAQEH